MYWHHFWLRQLSDFQLVNRGRGVEGKGRLEWVSDPVTKCKSWPEYHFRICTSCIYMANPPLGQGLCVAQQNVLIVRGGITLNLKWNKLSKRGLLGFVRSFGRRLAFIYCRYLCVGVFTRSDWKCRLTYELISDDNGLDFIMTIKRLCWSPPALFVH